MEKKKKMIWILHAGIEHPSPYFYNFCMELENHKDYEYIVNPNLPLNELSNNGILYFNRLKRFYSGDNLETAQSFLNQVDYLKKRGWKIVWTIHNFFPIDRELSYVDEYVTKCFINKCDLVFTLSEYMKKSVKEYYDVAAINHGMGISKLNNNLVNEGISKINKDDKFTFTFVGNINKYKMIDQVIDAFNRMQDCRLIIAGREAKNAGVNIDKLILNNKNIVYINSFVDEQDWKKLTKITDVFISIYNFNLPSFKYGLFPSNFINISRTGIKCISPKNEIMDEMISKEQLISYDLNEIDGLYNAMNRAKLSNNSVPVNIKYNYSWKKVVDVFIENCDKLF